MQALITHKKHNLPLNELQNEQQRLCTEKRASAISSCLAFPDSILEEILGSWCKHISSFLHLGSLCALDETMIPYYGKKAFDESKLQYIPGKPWDYGMVSYILCQRLQFTQLPVCLSVYGNFLGKILTPTQVALQLLRDIKHVARPNLAHIQLIADSLWSTPACLQELQQHQIRICLAIKPDNTFLPTNLIEIASSDLPIGCSRTYSKGGLLLQVTSEEDRSVAVITNCWTTNTQEATIPAHMPPAM